MASRDGVKARTVKQHLWSQKIDLPNGKRGTIPVTCVIARAFDAPAGTKPIEWRLLTSRTAASLDEVIKLIDWYRAR